MFTLMEFALKNVVDGNVNLDYTAFTKGSGEYEIGVATVKETNAQE